MPRKVALTLVLNVELSFSMISIRIMPNNPGIRRFHESVKFRLITFPFLFLIALAFVRQCSLIWTIRTPLEAGNLLCL